MGQLMIGGRSGARLKYNLFVQPTEPDVKNGLWIQTPAPVNVADVLLENGYIQENKISNEDDNIFKNLTGFSFGAKNYAYDNYVQEDGFFYEAQQIYRTVGSTSAYFIDLYKVTIATNTKELVVGELNPSQSIGAGICFKDGILYKASSIPSDSLSTYSTYGFNSFIGNPVYNLLTKEAVTGESAIYSLNDINGVGYYLCQNGGDYIYSINYSTNTISASPCFSTHAYVVQLFVYNGKLLLFQTGGIDNERITIYAYDPMTQTLSTYLTLDLDPNNSKLNSYYRTTKALIYGDNLYLFITPDNNAYTYGSHWGVINLAQKQGALFSENLGDGIEFVYRYYNKIAVFINVHVSGSGSSTVYKQSVTKQISLVNSVQPNNTLLLQNGNTYKMRVVGTDKLLSKMKKYTALIQNSPYYHRDYDFSIDDAWYYDNDFQEYPTYIGDGTQWTKIKN